MFDVVLAGNHHPRDYQIDMPGINYKQNKWIQEHKKTYCFKKAEFRYRQVIYNKIYKHNPAWSKFWALAAGPLQVEQGGDEDEEDEKELDQQQINICVADLPLSLPSTSSPPPCSTGSSPTANFEEKKVELQPHNDGNAAGPLLPCPQQVTSGANQGDVVQNCDQEDSKILESLLDNDHFLMLANMNAFVEGFDDMDKSDLSTTQLRQLRFQREFFANFVRNSLESIRAGISSHFFWILSYQLVVGWTGIKVENIVPPAETLPTGVPHIQSTTCEHVESSLVATRFLHQFFTQMCGGSVRFHMKTNCGICQKCVTFSSLLEVQVYARALIPLQHATIPFIAGSHYNLPNQNNFPVECMEVPVGSVCLLDPKLHFFISSNQFVFLNVVLEE